MTRMESDVSATDSPSPPSRTASAGNWSQRLWVYTLGSIRAQVITAVLHPEAPGNIGGPVVAGALQRLVGRIPSAVSRPPPYSTLENQSSQ